MPRRAKFDLFLLALITVPFDNLRIAPSAGWATISPFLFFAYVALNAKSAAALLRKNTLRVLLGLGVYEAAVLLVRGTTGQTIDSLGTVALGFAFYLALQLRYQSFGYDADRDARVLYHAYQAGLVYGLAQWYAIKHSGALLAFLNSLQRRYPNPPRVSFSFTEASFTGLHVYGMLFLFTYLVRDERLARRMLRLGACFVLVSVLAGSSTRCIVDTAVFAVLFLVRSFALEREKLARNLALLAGGCAAFAAVASRSWRVQNMLRNGFTADASGATRLFRPQAILLGSLEDPITALLGGGLGNLHLLFNRGYAAARAAYTNSYTSEVDSIKDLTEMGSCYCMPIKMLGEWGAVLTLAVFAYLFVRFYQKRLDGFVLVMTLWLYVQFDSYAFYSFWLLLFLANARPGTVQGRSYFVRLSAVRLRPHRLSYELRRAQREVES